MPNAAATIGPMAIRFRDGSDVHSHGRRRVSILDWCLCPDGGCDGLCHGADPCQSSFSSESQMRVALHLMVVAVISVPGLACSSVMDKEVFQVSRTTCPDDGPSQTSRTRTETGRLSASWSCASPADWSQYLTKLDVSLSRYRRRVWTADGATYSRHEPGDIYVLTLTRASGSPVRLTAMLVAGPD